MIYKIKNDIKRRGEFMYKRIRIFFIIIVFVSILIVGLFTSYVTNMSFLELQESYIVSKESQIEYFFEQNFKDLRELVVSNAVRTDAVVAMNDRNVEWLDANAAGYIIDDENFNIDYIYITTEDEKFSRSYGFRASDKLRSLKAYRDVLNDDTEITLLRWDGDELLIIYASPFYDNEMTSAQGVYMIARILDEDDISDLTKILSKTEVSELSLTKHKTYEKKKKYSDETILMSHLIDNYDGDEVYLNVDFRISYMDYLFNKQSDILMLISSAVAMLMLLVILYNLKIYTNKLGSVVLAINEISNENYHIKMDYQKSIFMPEMDDLVDSINKMSGDVESHVEAIEKHNEVINNRYLEMVKLLVDTVEMNDSYTYHHSVSVSEYAIIIGKAIGYADLENLELSAKLHDIGKIAISTQILNKPGALTDEEFNTIKTHSEEGYKLLKKIDMFSIAIDGVRYHHEKYNGFGYPMGLKGDEIPMMAQIISVADFYDALTSDRSYRTALTCREAMDIIISEKGKSLNPELVDVFYEELKKLNSYKYEV